jgi:DNA-binding MurR/RpiR family transcriptional regulator
MDVFGRIEASGDLTESDRAIVGHVLDHPDSIASLSVRGLAKASHTSPSAVMRLCRRLGFESWNAFKFNVASDLKRARPGAVSIMPNERALTASAKVAELERTAIEQTRYAMDLEAVQGVAGMLASAGEVDVCARDTNVIIAEYAAHLFSLAGRLASVRESIDPIIRFANLAPAGHAALFVSRGGHDTALLEAARILRGRGVPTALLTAAPDSPLAEACGQVLECYYGDLATFGEVVFHATARYVLDVLFTMLYSDDFEDNRRLAESHYEVCVERIYGEDVGDPGTMSRL